MYCVFLGRALQTVVPATNSITSAMLSGNLVTPGTLDVNGNELILDADADTSITADTDDQIDFKTGGTDRAQIDSSGNLKFNSGFGSVVTAYGVRSWVNFNGTGTVAIRASGNVSSITDVATGTFRVNFTTAMPDTNYCNVASVNFDTGGSSIQLDRAYQTTTYAYLEVRNAAQDADADRAYIHAAVFR